MLIDNIVEFCHQDYCSYEHCGNCKNIDSCGGNCKKCLDDLHFHSHCIRNDYDCERLLDFYVCRYSYKYCSEVIYALENVDFSEYPYLNILSLGCGGAADLFAFDYLDIDREIQYWGIDRNIFWEKIHDEIVSSCRFQKIFFERNIDVLDVFKKREICDCNVLSIGYLISFFYLFEGDRGIRNWFDQLVKQVIMYKAEDSPFLILINDVDSINTGRDTLLFFKDIIEQNGLNVSFEKRMRFKPDPYFPDSIQYPSRNNRFNIPDHIKENYYTAITCESAQLILEVR